MVRSIPFFHTICSVELSLLQLVDPTQAMFMDSSFVRVLPLLCRQISV